MNTKRAQNLPCFENNFCVCMLYISKEISTYVLTMLIKLTDDIPVFTQ